jgi:hypothetical protein
MGRHTATEAGTLPPNATLNLEISGVWTRLVLVHVPVPNYLQRQATPRATQCAVKSRQWWRWHVACHGAPQLSETPLTLASARRDNVN